MKRRRRPPVHYAIGTMSACGLNNLWHRPVSATTNPLLVTCQRCKASGYTRQAIYDSQP